MTCLSSSSFTPSTSSSLHYSMGPSTSSASPSPIDNFISEIMSTVAIDDVTLCRSCEDGESAFSKCADCSELLCDTCVFAHQRVSITRDHNISRFSGSSVTSPHATSVGSLGSSSMISMSPTSSYCDTHREPHRLYCNTCTTPACTECIKDEHVQHDVDYIEDSVQAVKTVNEKLSRETQSAIVAIKEAIEHVQRTYENVELRSINAAAEIRCHSRRYMIAVEQREIQLLSSVDLARQNKGKLLMSQKENLIAALTKLTFTAELFKRNINPTNAFDLIAINERATNDLKQVKALRPELLPCEDDCVMFLPPDNGLICAISAMGSVTIGSSYKSSIKIVRPPSTGRGPQFIANFRELTYMPMRNRPIFGVNPVVVKDFGPLPSLIFGGEGEGDGQLCRPWGVCCDSLGNIIVADRSNNRIQIFNPMGKFIHKFGSKGCAPGKFDRPAGVAINHLGNIVVADKDNHRVQIFKLDGTFIVTFGDKGSRNGQFNYPWDVACNSFGQIVVSDTRNHRIQLFTGAGKFLQKYGFEVSSPMWKHFDSPRGVCFTPKGNIVVTDFNNHRLVIVDPTFDQAQFLGQEGNNSKQFMRPQGVVCDDKGNIIVADSRNSRIQVFESNGAFLWKVGVLGKGAGEMDRPSGICLNPEGRIVVVDFGNNRVKVF